MKAVLLSYLLSLSLLSFSQDTTYYDENGLTVNSSSKSHYFAVKDKVEDGLFRVREFYSNGSIKSNSYYSDSELWVKDSIETYWHQNGELSSKIEYKQGTLNGTVLTFWENGEKKREDVFKNDRFVSGFCWDSLGNQIKHTEYLVMPYYKKCYKKRSRKKTNVCTQKKMQMFIALNTRYPKGSKSRGIKGTVYTRFFIDESGEVSNAEIIKGVKNGKDLERESLRVINSLPDMTPGAADGKKVKVQYTIPIRFNLR